MGQLITDTWYFFFLSLLFPFSFFNATIFFILSFHSALLLKLCPCFLFFLMCLSFPFLFIDHCAFNSKHWNQEGLLSIMSMHPGEENIQIQCKNLWGWQRFDKIWNSVTLKPRLLWRHQAQNQILMKPIILPQLGKQYY